MTFNFICHLNMQIHVSNSVVHNKPFILQMQSSLDLSNVFLSGRDQISVISLRTHLFRMPWSLARSGCDPWIWVREWQDTGTDHGLGPTQATQGWHNSGECWCCPTSCTLNCTSHMYTGHRYCQANGHQSQTRSFSSYNVTVLHLGVNITPQHQKVPRPSR